MQTALKRGTRSLTASIPAVWKIKRMYKERPTRTVTHQRIKSAEVPKFGALHNIVSTNLISNPLKSFETASDYIGPQYINYTFGKYGKTFYDRHTALWQLHMLKTYFNLCIRTQGPSLISELICGCEAINDASNVAFDKIVLIDRIVYVFAGHHLHTTRRESEPDCR